MTHVNGKNKGEIKLYALSTCVWCKKVKKLMDELGIGYDYVDCDLLDKKDSDDADDIVKKWNPKATYPTMIIDNKRALTGYDEQKIKDLDK